MEREERDERREKWVRDMGLIFRTKVKADHHMIESVVIYDWPREGSDRSEDHTIVMTVYEDGSFTTALDDGTVQFEKSKERLQRMALAAEEE